MEQRQMETETFSSEREWEIDGIPVLTARLALPQPVDTADRTARRIRRYYRSQARAYLRYCEHGLLPLAAEACRTALAASRPLPVFHAELRYCVTYHEGGFWSLYTQSREPDVDGGTLLRRWGDTWDLRTGYPVPLSRFFPPRSGWKRQLLSQAAAEFQRREAAGQGPYVENWRKRLRRGFDPMNYYLTPEGLTVFFPMYTIDAREGIPVFTCPWDAPSGEGEVANGAPPHWR